MFFAYVSRRAVFVYIYVSRLAHILIFYDLIFAGFELFHLIKSLKYRKVNAPKWHVWSKWWGFNGNLVLGSYCVYMECEDKIMGCTWYDIGFWPWLLVGSVIKCDDTCKFKMLMILVFWLSVVHVLLALVIWAVLLIDASEIGHDIN